MNEQGRRYTVAVDFDGVLHRYDTPFIDAVTIPDEPVEGAIEWLGAIAEKFDVVIFTTRARTPGGRYAVIEWLRDHGVDHHDNGIIVTDRKPPALVYIDDRAWRFKGRFPTRSEIHRALPWHKEGAAPSAEQHDWKARAEQAEQIRDELAEALKKVDDEVSIALVGDREPETLDEHAQTILAVRRIVWSDEIRDALIRYADLYGTQAGLGEGKE